MQLSSRQSAKVERHRGAPIVTCSAGLQSRCCDAVAKCLIDIEKRQGTTPKKEPEMR